MANVLKRNAVRTRINAPLIKSRESVIGEWLCHYALTIRDAATLPAVITPAAIEAYAVFLDDCEPERLGRAMKAAGQGARYFPRPEQIRLCYQALSEREERGNNRCEACIGGYVQSSKGLVSCRICSPGAGRNGKKS